MLRSFRAPLALLLAALLQACATIEPPLNPKDPVAIYVADYDGHASIILPAPTGLAEYAYGEWRWFALDDKWLIRGPGILLLPSKGALGRRILPVTEAWSEDSLGRATGAKRILTITVAGEPAAALSRSLDSRFRGDPPGLVYNATSRMDFVPDPAPYWIFHTCNTQTADWLRTLGCHVHSCALSSDFQLRSATARPPPPAGSPAAGPSQPGRLTPSPSGG